MGLYKFSIAAAASPSDIETKITSVRGQGANIYLHTIVDIGNLNLSINDKNVTINYDLIGTKQNSLFNWYICDTVGYETIIILYNSGTESDSTFGLANYNRIYFNVKNQLVSNPKISATLSAQFNVLRGRFDSYESDGSDDDVIMLTKCVYNDGSNIETGEAIVTDNLYVSTNLRSTSFKTIVKDEDGKQFINVGGIFYLPYSEEIIYPSWSEKQWILPPGTVDYEWHPASTIVPQQKYWYNISKDRYFFLSSDLSGENNIIKNNNDFSLNIQTYHYKESSQYPYRVNSFAVDLKKELNTTICYFVIQKDKQIDGNYGYITINGDGNYEGTSFFDTGDNRISLKSCNWYSGDYGPSFIYWQTNFLDINYLVIAAKIISSGSSNHPFANATHSFWINGGFLKEFYNINNNNITSSNQADLARVQIRNCNIKYFAIVEHDQTSEEIIKTSQLLMDKFDIH